MAFTVGWLTNDHTLFPCQFWTIWEQVLKLKFISPIWHSFGEWPSYWNFCCVLSFWVPCKSLYFYFLTGIQPLCWIYCFFLSSCIFLWHIYVYRILLSLMSWSLAVLLGLLLCENTGRKTLPSIHFSYVQHVQQ